MGWISLSGIAFTVDESSTTSLSLINGWLPYGGDYGTPSVSVKNGFCIVEGLVKNGAWGNISTLPMNCRPQKRLVFNLNNQDKTSRVDVLTDGQILWFAGGKDYGFISLSGIVFVP